MVKYIIMDGENNFSSDQSTTSSRSQGDQVELSWTSSETSITKGSSWYLILVIITLVIGGLIYLLTKDLISSLVIVFCGIMLLVYSIKKPKSVNYRITDSSIYIANKAFNIGNFKSFSIVNQGFNKSLALVPMKRFYPYVYLDLNQDISADVIQRLSKIIPVEKKSNDLFESFLRFIKL